MGSWSKFFSGFFQKKRPLLKKSKPKKETDKEEESYEKILDDLLDKINKRGYDSLTSREKNLLKKASDYLGRGEHKGDDNT